MTDDLEAQKALEDYKASLVSEQRLNEQQREAKLAAWLARQQTRSDLFKSTISSGQLTVRTLVTLCGGAIVAILALIGNLANKSDPAAKEIVAAAEKGAPWYAIALLIGSFAIGVMYLSQASYTFQIDNEEQEGKFQYWQLVGNGLNLFCIALVATAFVFFCIGVVETIPARFWPEWIQCFLGQ